MKIEQIAHIANSDANIFYENLIVAINKLQQNDLTVEIQYQASEFSNEYMSFSALLIGRKL